MTHSSAGAGKPIAALAPAFNAERFTDAALDTAAVQELSAWLAANAATARRVGEAPPEDRITLSTWVTRKHDEVPVATWKRRAVKSAANCTACHTQADQGDFNEHKIRIPR
jgi:hypothetical protein